MQKLQASTLKTISYLLEIALVKLYKSHFTTEINMAHEEEIGFHKGAVTTLLKERQEFVRMISIIDALLKAHSEALQKLGIGISKPEEKKTVKKK
jgi:hypothetical protein